MNKLYKLLLLGSFIFTISLVNAQRINLGAGNITSTNFFGPFNTSVDTASYSRYAMIYPAGVMPGIRHGDTINALDFERIGALKFKGVGLCKIWMANTKKVDFGSNNIHFIAERLTLNAKLVFTGNPFLNFDSASGYKNFKLDTFHPYDTSKGENLVFFIEYKQDSSIPFAVAWSCDVAGDFPDYKPNQVKFVRGMGPTIPDSTSNSSDIHPHIRLYIPRQDYEGAIIIPYVYGKIPVPLGNPDTIKLLIANYGKKTVNNLKVFVSSRGSNVFKDSTIVSSINAFEEKLIKFPTRSISNIGYDTLTFTLPIDSNPSDNVREHVRLATQNIYSYRHLAEPLGPGGIGFNGSSGNFVAQFSSNAVKAINQVEVSFGFGGQPFRAGIWDINKSTGKPGKLLWQSDSLTSTAKSIIPVFPPVFVNGNFYVGVRQLGTTNVSFAYQLEQPVRKQTFWYSAPLADTNWVDFAPDAPFRFMIEPRLQAEHDVTILSIDSPKNGAVYNFFNYDTIHPTATIYNLGVNNVDTPINFKCNVFRGASNVLVFTANKKDTIASGVAKKISFDTFYGFQFTGNYRQQVISQWSKDDVKENDTLESNFTVQYLNDVGPDLVFSPSFGQLYEYKFDSVKPVYRVRNFADNDQTNVKVRSRILKGNIALSVDSFTIPSLPAGNSIIIGHKAWFANVLDTLIFEATTGQTVDVNRQNDTFRVPFRIAKYIDIASDSIISPAPEEIITGLSGIPRPKVRVKNDGINNISNAQTFISIKNNQGKTIYSDTQIYNLGAFSTTLVQFIDTLKLSVKGRYTLEAISRVSRNFYTQNDTLRSVFYFGVERDAVADGILSPDPNSIYELNVGVFAPKARISNNGFDSIKNAPVKLSAISKGNVFYASTKFVTLDSNQSKILTFDSLLIFSEDENITLQLVTLLPNDQIKSNDTLVIAYNVQTSNDVSVDSITLPNADSLKFTVRTVFVPKASLTNTGLKKQLNPFDVNCTITNSKGNKIYDQIISTTLDSAENIDLSFIQPFELWDTGKYTLKVRAFLNSDQRLINDEKTLVFFGYIGSNNKVADSFPRKNTRYIPGIYLDTIHPSIKITKTGADNLADSGKAYMVLKGRHNNYVYNDSIAFSLPENTDTVLVFSKPYNTHFKDTFDAKIRLESSMDGDTLDNQISFVYFVDYGVGIKSITPIENLFKITPNPSDGLWKIISQGVVKITQISIIDASGRKVFTKNLPEGTMIFELDLRNLADGIYYLQVNEYEDEIKLMKLGNH